MKHYIDWFEYEGEAISSFNKFLKEFEKSEDKDSFLTNSLDPFVDKYPYMAIGWCWLAEKMMPPDHFRGIIVDRIFNKISCLK